MSVSFKVSREDYALCREIAERAWVADNAINGVLARDQITWQMDIIACHANGCRLDLQRFLEADGMNFNHDAFGIARHLNRDTGALEDYFLPRFATREA